MPDKNTGNANPFHILWHRLTSDFIQTVPDEIAVCEFDCRKADCTAEEWRNCKRRLHRTSWEIKRAA